MYIIYLYKLIKYTYINVSQMYQKKIIQDGFKSYANRTEIDGFDRNFNAITGLNGTGKSNILDSICFVQGITNLSNIRVQEQKDQVYKSGQVCLV